MTTAGRETGRGRCHAAALAAPAPGWLRWLLPGVLMLLAFGLRPERVGAQAFPPQGQLAELAESLSREGTYVASRTRPQVPLAAEEHLQQLITRAEFQGVTLRLGVLDQVPRGYAHLNEFAVALGETMRLRNAVLVVATPQQVTALSDQVPADDAAALVAGAQGALERDGVVAGLETAAEGLVARVAQTVVPEVRPTVERVTLTPRAPERGTNGPPGWVLVPGLALLGAGVGLYGWTTRRRWHEVLGALEGAEVAASELATTGQAAPTALENAQQRLAIGQRALAALRAVPWWQTWLWPWLPPPQLGLAERAFSESLRLLGDPIAGTAAAPASAWSDVALASDVAVAPGAPPSAHPAAAAPGAPPAAPATPAGVNAEDQLDGSPATSAGSAAPTVPAASASDRSVLVPPPAAPALPDATPPVGSPGSVPVVGAPGPAPSPTPPAAKWWWQRRQPATDAEPAASLDPEHVLKGLARQQPVGCFFCGRPLGPRDAEITTVPLAGLPVRPLVCPHHAAALAAGDRPGVHARQVDGREVAWFQDPEFHPAWDYNPSDSGPTVAWDALPPPDELLEPAPAVIVHADDPRWPAMHDSA